ncbi:hypothetical protein [Nostoc sp.]|uniref:hypothetical protein n=1 Tax=Nostoc sp. TaxID=1180 RepID=UPI002FF87310
MSCNGIHLTFIYRGAIGASLSLIFYRQDYSTKLMIPMFNYRVLIGDRLITA